MKFEVAAIVFAFFFHGTIANRELTDQSKFKFFCQVDLQTVRLMCAILVHSTAAVYLMVYILYHRMSAVRTTFFALVQRLSWRYGTFNAHSQFDAAELIYLYYLPEDLSAKPTV
jgi:hypothetical protein